MVGPRLMQKDKVREIRSLIRNPSIEIIESRNCSRLQWKIKNCYNDFKKRNLNTMHQKWKCDCPQWNPGETWALSILLNSEALPGITTPHLTLEKQKRGLLLFPTYTEKQLPTTRFIENNQQLKMRHLQKNKKGRTISYLNACAHWALEISESK